MGLGLLEALVTVLSKESRSKLLGVHFQPAYLGLSDPSVFLKEGVRIILIARL